MYDLKNTMHHWEWLVIDKRHNVVATMAYIALSLQRWRCNAAIATMALRRYCYNDGALALLLQWWRCGAITSTLLQWQHCNDGAATLTTRNTAARVARALQARVAVMTLLCSRRWNAALQRWRASSPFSVFLDNCHKRARFYAWK